MSDDYSPSIDAMLRAIGENSSMKCWDDAEGCYYWVPWSEVCRTFSMSRFIVREDAGGQLAVRDVSSDDSGMSILCEGPYGRYFTPRGDVLKQCNMNYAIVCQNETGEFLVPRGDVVDMDSPFAHYPQCDNFYSQRDDFCSSLENTRVWQLQCAEVDADVDGDAAAEVDAEVDADADADADAVDDDDTKSNNLTGLDDREVRETAVKVNAINTDNGLLDAMLSAIHDGNVDFIKYVLTCVPDIQADTKNNALLEAQNCGREDIVDLLVAKGASKWHIAPLRDLLKKSLNNARACFSTAVRS